MKTALTLLMVLVLALGGYLGVAHFSGGAFPTLGLPLGGELGQLRSISESFMEDLQYKDFKHAASYHQPDVQDTVDIPFLLKRVFVVKPEALEIMEYEVVMADLDSTGDRGRVKLRVKANDLIREQILTRELMLYFKRDGRAAPWYMELEDSLRKDKAEKDKKH